MSRINATLADSLIGYLYLTGRYAADGKLDFRQAGFPPEMGTCNKVTVGCARASLMAGPMPLASVTATPRAPRLSASIGKLIGPSWVASPLPNWRTWPE